MGWLCHTLTMNDQSFLSIYSAALWHKICSDCWSSHEEIINTSTLSAWVPYIEFKWDSKINFASKSLLNENILTLFKKLADSVWLWTCIQIDFLWNICCIAVASWSFKENIYLFAPSGPSQTCTTQFQPNPNSLCGDLAVVVASGGLFKAREPSSCYGLHGPAPAQ